MREHTTFIWYPVEQGAREAIYRWCLKGNCGIEYYFVTGYGEEEVLCNRKGRYYRKVFFTYYY